MKLLWTTPAVMMLICLTAHLSFGQKLTPFEQDTAHNTTATYEEALVFYQYLAERYPQRFHFSAFGKTDSGKPLHVGILSNKGFFDPKTVRSDSQIVVFVNNAIHPGEPCGVDATMMLVRDLLEKPQLHELGDEVCLVFLPFYNIGGVLNRGAYSRANQTGPRTHGFRGNAKNLDLNRDFIKCDSKNAISFNQIFTRWKPEILVDNHTSNGADYQHVLTLVNAQIDKLGAPLAAYMEHRMLPYLYQDLAKRGWDLSPYVYARTTPDDGIYGFLDLPRYSSGYAALHHTLAFMPEAHMLKPYHQRVWATYAFMKSILQLAATDHQRILMEKQMSIQAYLDAEYVPIDWTLDIDQVDSFLFSGYEAAFKKSLVSGQQRLYYRRDRPYQKQIPVYDTYRANKTAKVPYAYLIPQAWTDVLDRLRWNGVTLHRLTRDTSVLVEQCYIDSFVSVREPYEGHYLHSDVSTSCVMRTASFRSGDYIALTDQPAVRYLVETLEPQAPDSYFAWNFFDAICMQKEYFSDYVFEDLAAQILSENQELSDALERKRRQNSEFASDAKAQLAYVYRHSPYYESTHRLYPIAKIITPVHLPMHTE